MHMKFEDNKREREYGKRRWSVWYVYSYALWGLFNVAKILETKFFDKGFRIFSLLNVII